MGQKSTQRLQKLQVDNYRTAVGNDRVDVIVPMSPLTTPDEFIYLLACSSPRLLRKPAASVKTEEEKKETRLHKTTEAYLFHLKGEV